MKWKIPQNPTKSHTFVIHFCYGHKNKFIFLLPTHNYEIKPVCKNNPTLLLSICYPLLSIFPKNKNGQKSEFRCHPKSFGHKICVIFLVIHP